MRREQFGGAILQAHQFFELLFKSGFFLVDLFSAESGAFNFIFAFRLLGESGRYLPGIPRCLTLVQAWWNPQRSFGQ